MVISPDSAIEKQKNEHTHNFERTAPKFDHFYLVRSIMHQGQTTAYSIQAKKQVLPVYQIEKALKAILSHSRKVDLDPDEWPLMIEIAQRVKDNLPNIKIVPDGQD